jgi:hypothetical protein
LSISQTQIAFVRSEELREELNEDYAGNTARRLITYFTDAASTAKALEIKANDAAERQSANALREAFSHSAKLIAEVWSSVHGQKLDGFRAEINE